MVDALIFLLVSPRTPGRVLSRDWFPHTDLSPAKHIQCAVSDFSQLPVDGVRAAQKPHHWGPPWHQFVHRDIKPYIATREFQSRL